MVGMPDVHRKKVMVILKATTGTYDKWSDVADISTIYQQAGD